MWNSKLIETDFALLLWKVWRIGDDKMGKKDKNKKAGKGAEKTAMKTQKKLKNKLMKLTGEVCIWYLKTFWIPNTWIPDSSEYGIVWVSGIQMIKSRDLADHLYTRHFGP